MKKILFSVLSLATAGIAMAQNADTFALNRIGQQVTLSDINSSYVGCDCYVMDTTYTIGLVSGKAAVRHGGSLKAYNASGNAGKVSTSAGWTVSGTKISLTKPCYYLPGLVHIDSGVTMNIPAGTVFYGSKTTFSAFVHLPKAKVEAKGSAAAPIIFTSSKSTRERGDWGGVVICGRAPIAGEQTSFTTGTSKTGNMSYIEGLPQRAPYFCGGNTAADYSGTYAYVQVNYAGLNVGASGSGNELNSFSLYGVGSATKMNNLQVAYANDDAIEIFGGAVNVTHMFILNTLDDDIDLDGGYQGTIQNVLVYRLDTLSRDISRSRLGEISNKNYAVHSRKTMPVITNVTAFGTRAFVGKTYTFGTLFGAANSRNMTGFSINQQASARIYNSVIHGYDQAFHVDDSFSAKNLSLGWGAQFAYNSWNQCTNDITVGSTVKTFNIANDFPYDNKDNWVRYFQASNFKGASDDIKNLGYNVTLAQATYPAIANLNFYATHKADYGNLASALQKFGSGFGSNDTLDSRKNAVIKETANRGITVSKLTGWTSTNPTEDYCGSSTPFSGSTTNDNVNTVLNNSNVQLFAINPSEGAINVEIDGVAKNQLSSVQVYDMSGKLVKTTSVSGSSIKIEGMNVGLYTVVVSGNNSQESIKVFVK